MGVLMNMKSFASGGECLMMSWPGFHDCRTKLHPRFEKGKKEKKGRFFFKADRTLTAAVGRASV